MKYSGIFFSTCTSTISTEKFHEHDEDHVISKATEELLNGPCVNKHWNSGSQL